MGVSFGPLSQWKTWRRFTTGQAGNITVMTALSAVILAGAAGAAVDYQRASSARLNLQSALDAATLAAAAEGGTDIDQTALENRFLANAKLAGFEIEDLDFDENGAGQVTGTVVARLPTSFLGVLGVQSLNVSASTTAQAKKQQVIQSATFEIVNAQGAYDKNIYFFTRDEDGKMKKELVLQYNYSYSKGRGSKVFTPRMTESITINPDDYASWGIAMEVFEDLSYTGKHINPVWHYSDDADAHKWTKTEGDCADEDGQVNYWEDGGDSNFLDFVFNLKCTTIAGSGSESVRLVE